MLLASSPACALVCAHMGALHWWPSGCGPGNSLWCQAHPWLACPALGERSQTPRLPHISHQTGSPLPGPVTESSVGPQWRERKSKGFSAHLGYRCPSPMPPLSEGRSRRSGSQPLGTRYVTPGSVMGPLPGLWPESGVTFLDPCQGLCPVTQQETEPGDSPRVSAASTSS